MECRADAPILAAMPQSLHSRGLAMADRRGLGIVGFVLGAVTAAVMLVAGAVVHAHLDGRLALDGPDQQVAALSLIAVAPR